MKILLVSPLAYPITEVGNYAGIERLVWEYAKELIKSHDVTVMAHADSVFPDKVQLLTHKPMGDPIAAELKHYQMYQYLLRTFDVIHDFSHLHLIARFNSNLPTLNIFWHAPSLARYPKAPYNIIALSQWAAREFERVYRQKARYQQSIAIDIEIYHPQGERGNRFLTIGRMSPLKGNLRAILLCQQAGVPIDVCGGRGMEKAPELDDYEKAIQGLCDGDKAKFHGEISEGQKVKLMQSCRALIYAADYPEVTSHKIQEVLLCGAPVIAPALGGIPEIITHGVDGFLCRTDDEFLAAIRNIDQLNPQVTHEAIVGKYSVKEVCAQYTELYKQVNEGLRW